MAVTMATAEQALKLMYLGTLRNQLNTETNPLYNKIASSTKDIVGKNVVKMAPFGVNGGYGAGTETGLLPAANGNQYIQFVSETKNLYGTIEISDKSIEASSNNAGAFVNLLTQELDGLTRAAKFNLGRQLFQDGSGLLAVCGVTNAATKVVVASTQYLMEGMTIDILTIADGSVVATGRRVLDVDRDNNTITISGAAVTTAATHGIYVQGSKGLELTGLAEIFKTSGKLYGVDRSVNSWMKPYISDLSASPIISDIKIQAAIDRVKRVSGGRVNYISCSDGVKRSYIEYLEATKRTVNSMELKGGFSAISYNNIPIVDDVFEPAGTMDLLDTTQFTLHHMGDWRWLGDKEGSILKQKAGYAVWVANLVRYAELICDHPGAQARIKGITEDDGIA